MDMITSYCETDIPYDKAGGYGIQSYGGSSFISSIHGDYYNVMGLPLNKLCILLLEALNSLENTKI